MLSNNDKTPNSDLVSNRQYRLNLSKTLSMALIAIISVTFGNPIGAKARPPTVLDPVVVSASHIPSTLDITSASTTIISREEIEARQAISAVDLLRQVSGLHIDQPGGRGGVSSIYVRGSDPNFTVVLIDGIKVNDPNNSRGGSFDLSTLDPTSIERIEIVRGPLSSVHGSDAMGGVINIITRSATADPVTVLDVDGGTKDYYRAGFETRGPLGAADVAFNLSYVDDGSPVAGSQFVGKNISGKLTFSPSNTQWLELVSRYGDSESESFPDDSGGPEFAVIRAVDQREAEEWTVGLSYGHHLVEGFEYSFNAAYYLRQEETVSLGVEKGIRDPFGIPPNLSDNRFDRTNFLIKTIFSPSPSAQLSIGAEAQLENGESEGSLLFGNTPVPNSFDFDRQIVSAFLEARWATPIGVTLEGGARLDDPEGFDTKVSPRIGLIYGINSTQSILKANWGEGFKLPSFFALGNAIVGNTALLPETSRSFEAGLVQNFMSKRIRLNMIYFNNRFFNLIDLDEGPPPLLVNRSEVNGEGGELELSVQANKTLWINGHISYTETDIQGTTEGLRNRPKWRGGINTRWQVKENVLSNLNVLYVGESLDSSIATGDLDLNAYIRVDVATIWKILENWELSIAVDNLFDADYEEAIGFQAPGIRGRLGLRWVI